MAKDKTKVIVNNGKFKENNIFHKLSPKNKGNYKLTLIELTNKSNKYIQTNKKDFYHTHQLNHKTSEVIKIKTVKKPLTILGYCNYIGISTKSYYKWLKEEDNKTQIETVKGETYTRKDIITLIDQLIKEDQISGAIGNQYNANIVSKIQGLAEIQEIREENKTLKIELIPTATRNTTPGQTTPLKAIETSQHTSTSQNK